MILSKGVLLNSMFNNIFCMFELLKKIKRAISVFLPSRKSIGSAGINSYIEFPVYISCPKSVSMEADTRLRGGSKILVSEKCKVWIKKYSVVGMNCMIVANKHVSTVGIPQILLGASGINDQNNNIVIEEDTWIGSNVTIMGNITVGRGSLVGACSLVTKSIPPYAIVIGSPAKIIAVKFSIDQILVHEQLLYSESERFKRDYLEKLFSQYYSDKPVFGVTTEFTDDVIETLKNTAKNRKFTNVEYFDRITKMKNNTVENL